jgi:hypothetical protein
MQVAHVTEIIGYKEVAVARTGYSTPNHETLPILETTEIRGWESYSVSNHFLTFYFRDSSSIHGKTIALKAADVKTFSTEEVPE